MSGGTETRTQILPSKAPEDTGYTLPNYDFAGNLATPASVGVRNVEDAGIGDIVNSAKGIIYYTDVIGFGESSSSLTSGMPFNKMGINFFMKSGMQCSNGADMWTYFQGIPDGSALGTTLRDAMDEMRMPPMRGLAPGIMEDAKAALNPTPLLRATFGDVYPECVQQELPVGDDRGYITDPNCVKKCKNNKQCESECEPWIKGPVIYKNGRPHQTKWVQKTKNGNPVYLSKEQYDNTPKTHNPDGTPKSTSGFEDVGRVTLLTAIVLGCLTLAFVKRR